MSAVAPPREIERVEEPRSRVVVDDAYATSVVRGTAYLAITLVLLIFWGGLGYLVWSLVA